MGERAPAQPITVLRGRAGLAFVPFAPCAFLGFLWVAVPSASSLLALPPEVVPPLADPLRAPTPMLVSALAACVVAVLLTTLVAGRVGRVEVHADRLVRSHPPFVVFLRDVTAFDDARHEVLHLRRRAAEAVGIPTARGDRAPLIEALVARGLPRFDAGARDPAAVDRGAVQGSSAPAQAPLLVVESGEIHSPERAAILVAIGLTLGAAGMPIAPIISVAGGGLALVGLALSVSATRIAARFLDDRVVITRHALTPSERTFELGWDDLAGWRDHGSGVELVVGGSLRDLIPRDLPLLAPDDRRAVASLLESRGVPRLA